MAMSYTGSSILEPTQRPQEYLEIREHGTGYFGFSKNDEERARQLSQLKKLSAETVATRLSVQNEKKGKKALLKERLRKIKARKRAKLGLSPPKEESEEDEEEEMKKEVEEVKEEVNKSSVVDALRAWDFGKPGVYGPKPTNFDELDAKWLKDRREDRKTEFAPPSSYGRKTIPSSSSKYSNFVTSSEESRKATSRAHVPLPAHRAEAIKPIQNEVLVQTPSFGDFQRKREGVEIAPPPTFEYYHGESRGSTKKAKIVRGPSDEVVSEAIAQGINKLRRELEEKQMRKSSHDLPHKVDVSMVIDAGGFTFFFGSEQWFVPTSPKGVIFQSPLDEFV